MEKKHSQKHSIETLYFSISILFERASHYGIRALIVLYMIGETMNMEREEALSIFGWLSTILIFSKIIGGIFGDLLIGNRKSIIIGGIMQSIGAFSLCIPSTVGLYCGLLLMVLGSGFFFAESYFHFREVIFT